MNMSMKMKLVQRRQVPQVWHLRVLVHIRCSTMTSGLPVQQNCGSRSSGLDPESPQHDGVQRWRRICLNPTQLLTREPRGRERFEREGGGAGGEESSSCNCVLLLLGASSLYRGRWERSTPPPSQGEVGRRPRTDVWLLQHTCTAAHVL